MASNILSASSKIKCLTIFKSIIFFSNKSINLPGVATKISHPLSNSKTCIFLPSPPYTATVLIPVLKVNFLLSLLTWTANSLVGTNINDNG